MEVISSFYMVFKEVDSSIKLALNDPKVQIGYPCLGKLQEIDVLGVISIINIFERIDRGMETRSEN